MTPKTLTKERREKFEKILNEFGVFPTTMYQFQNAGKYGNPFLLSNWRRDLILALVATAESRSEVRGIEAAIFADRPVEESDLGDSDEALKAFESAMHLPGNWQWYPAKSTDEAAWKGLREFVTKIYRQDKGAFQRYFTWSLQPFVSGAMNALSIKNNPGNFEASWAVFEAKNGKKTDETRGVYKIDEDGVPETY